MNHNHRPTISIVVLNCNGKKLLERCLSSVFASQHQDLEVIVVDNASSDGSANHILEKFGDDRRFKIVRNASNVGVAEGHNVGIKNSTGRYIAFLDNDTKISQNWIGELANALDADPTVGAVQGKILLMEDRAFFDSTGGCIDYYGISCERGNRTKDIGQFDQAVEIFHSKCSAMMVRRSVLDEVGWFDPKYFTHYDDTDLCWRMRLRGYKVLYVPNASVFHNVSLTAIGLRLDQVYFLCKNCITTLIKNYETGNLLRYLPGFLSLELSRSLFYFARRDKRAVSLLKAVIWNLSSLKNTWRKRVDIQFSRKISDQEIMDKFMIKPPSLAFRFLNRTVQCKE